MSDESTEKGAPLCTDADCPREGRSCPYPNAGCGVDLSIFYDACPQCGGGGWASASDGLGDITTVAAVCLSCGYLAVSTVDLGGVTPSETSDR